MARNGTPPSGRACDKALLCPALLEQGLGSVRMVFHINSREQIRDISSPSQLGPASLTGSSGRGDRTPVLLGHEWTASCWRMGRSSCHLCMRFPGTYVHLPAYAQCQHSTAARVCLGAEVCASFPELQLTHQPSIHPSIHPTSVCLSVCLSVSVFTRHVDRLIQ